MLFIRLISMAFILLSLPVNAAADDDVIWIDVRSVEEYDAGHIEGHPNIPHEDIALRISELTTDKNTPIRLYCRSGRRSGIARETLRELGYSNVENMGGYEEVRATLETEAEAAPAH